MSIITNNEGIKIIAFLCWKWGYGGADMAGTIRAQYPTSIRSILVPCTGRVGPDLIMRAFGRGADGVMVVGWYPNECDYETGNYTAHRQVEYVKEVLETMGVDGQRVMMKFCSAAEGQRFQRLVTEFCEKVKKIGPSPFRAKDKRK